MDDLLLRVLYDVLVLLATVAAGYAVAWFRKRLGVEGMKRIEAELAAKQELAALAVRFVEQVYKDIHGEAKYQKAAEWLAARAGELGLKITPEEIKGLIEAALRTFKDEFGEEWAKQA
ncbi:MAG: phage holin [Syntrophothermus sp.]|uniref:phage holin n=1 Tax=Syntrophothermus sp. TaxID=2736299 RepID=UPI002579E4AA|nr:phage holin [Syntrophothermus sp.]NSW82506.1 phage holin [Syntrophothermus sp.]